MIYNIPNLLTLSRVIAIPIVLILFHAGHLGVALGVLVISLLTDFFDGKLARWLRQETQIGSILDPIADKFVVIGYFGFMLLDAQIPAWLCLLYLARNFSQLMAIPILSWWLKRPFFVKPKWQPKWAGALCFVILPMLMFPFEFALKSEIVTALIIPSVILEVYVLVTYVPRLVAIAWGRHDTFE